VVVAVVEEATTLELDCSWRSASESGDNLLLYDTLLPSVSSLQQRLSEGVRIIGLAVRRKFALRLPRGWPCWEKAEENGMARLTRTQKEEIVSTFYGINPKTCKVESVSVTRGGKLQDMNLYSHALLPGRQPRTEIRLVYGLADLFEVYPHFQDTEYMNQKVEELKTKAAEMRAGAGAMKE
jgi:hypothetical protein